MSNNDDATIRQLNLSELRAQRLKRLRSVLRLSRKALSELYKIPAGTLQNWEDARHGGLTEKGAQRFIEVLKTEGIECRLEWLLFGIGNPPKELLASNAQKTVLTQEISQQSRELDDITQELMVFYTHNSNAVDLIISDDAMDPSFLLGDHVAGKRYFNDDIAKLIEQSCIIQTQTGILTVRKLMQGSKKGYYDLIAINKNSKIPDLYFYNIRVFSAAPITWIRRTITI